MSVRLVPFGVEHVPAFAQTVTDPDIVRFTGVPVPPPDGWIEKWRTGYAESDDKDNFAILDDTVTEHDGFAGWAVGFGRQRGDDAVIELGYALSPWARGRGIATEALRQLSRWALDDGMLRLVLQIQVANTASQRVAERVGYTLEGTLRSVHHKNGERVDLQTWSLLPGELR